MRMFSLISIIEYTLGNGNFQLNSLTLLYIQSLYEGEINKWKNLAI